MNRKSHLASGLVAVAAFALAAILSPMAIAQTASASMKIGVFDPARISQETAAGARIQARLNALQDQKRKELETRQDDIVKLEQEFVASAASLSQEKRKELGLSIERKRIELEGLQKSAMRELQLEVEQAQTEWQARVLQHVQSFGRDNGYMLVLQNDVVGYYAQAIDVTEELIRLIDQPDSSAGS